MSQLETLMMQSVRKAISRGPWRWWRNNNGMGWQGESIRVTSTNLNDCRDAIQPGDLILSRPRPLHAGLQDGSGDYIGWREIIIQEHMLGQRIAQFVSAEAKGPRGALRTDQRRWLEQVRRSGGLAFVFTNLEDARRAMDSGLAEGH
jgi:hypothetical protein